jgi:hypothetical protein
MMHSSSFRSPLAWLFLMGASSFLTLVPVSRAAELPIVDTVERQPLISATERLVQSLEFVGAPMKAEDRKKLDEILKDPNPQFVTIEVQKILDPYCLALVTINAESRVSVTEGAVAKQLIEQGWRTFLVKVHNEAGVTAPLKPESPNMAPLFKRGTGSPKPKIEITPDDVPQRFLDVVMYDKQPLKATLSGLKLEYRIIQLYTRESGQREVQLGFHVGQGTQDLGFRNSVPILFQCIPAVEVLFDIKDFDGQPTTASFVIRDKLERVYPNPARRLAPDFFFHNQIYRASGENIHLPPGEYSIEVSRGPEYLVEMYPLTVPEKAKSTTASFALHRWIHPAKRNWISGDHHVHAAGCAHYENPTEGVTPSDMMRHILGEDLNVGCVLSWGPCWYSQKQYFEGKTSALSQPSYLMRYDVEVSGFPSSHAGHLCLLRLKEDDYEGTTLIEQWPSWTEPVLAWGQKQGGVVGYSHSGWGLALPDFGPNGQRIETGKGKAADKLPDMAMPKFDGIGANEYIVTTTSGVCDFISTVDTPSIHELNIWYHTMNCGMRTRISGETDFPCIYGDKVGLGRVYVKLNAGQDLNYDNWVDGLKQGRSYCGDGLSHILDFRATPLAADGKAGKSLGMGDPNEKGQFSQLNLEQPTKVRVEFDAAALLAPKPTPATEAIRSRRLDHKPYWHLERCRIGDTREVPVEIIVNGKVAATRNLVADGKSANFSFDLDIPHSSWVAVRILPSIHTNPIFIEIGGQPIRASKQSAEWCIKAVETCWNSKVKGIRASEKVAAKAAYDKASAIYKEIAEKAIVDTQ